MSTPLYVDNSTLAALAACDTRAMLRYVHGYSSQEESFALQTGTAVHTALEVYFKTGERKPALQAFRAAYEDWALEHVPAAPEKSQLWTLRYAFENVRDIVRTWIKRHPLADEPYTVYPDLVEIGFAFPIADDVIFYGRYDGIVEEKASGQYFVLDHKTTGQLTSDWAASFRLSTQMTGYVWAAQQLLDKPVGGAIINGIQISKLPDIITNKDGSIRKCREHGIGIDECRLTHVKESFAITQRDARQIEQWKRQALKLAARLQMLKTRFPEIQDLPKLQTQGMFAGACRYCDFKAFCETGRQVERVDQMLTYNPWQPYKTDETKEKTCG